jgi:septal ring factor EnvC (AmiA/AmiB activator)
MAILLLTLLLSRSTDAQDPLPEEQLQALNVAIERIEDWLHTASSNRSELETELRRVNAQIETSTRASAESREAISELENRLLTLKRQVAELEAARAEQESLIRQALRSAYMSGQDSYIKLLLNQEDLSLSARMLTYYANFNAARLTRIEAFRSTLIQLETSQQELSTASEHLREQEQALALQLESLHNDNALRLSLLQELEADIASRSGELDQLLADRTHLEELLQQIEDAIASIPPPEQLTPFVEARGRLPWPLEGSPMNRFGATYSDGNLHRQGIILSAAAGTPVRAIHPGRIVFSDWLRGSGLLVVVDHGEGYLSLYANAQALVKQKGDWVNRGEALATAGSNGGMEAPGIYFEIRHNGQAEDPAVWCQG